MFSNYSLITYNNQKIVNISKRFIFKDLEEQQNIYFIYTIDTYKTPESIAYDYYGSPDYEWVIRVLNNYDTYFDNLPYNYTFDPNNILPEANQLWLLNESELVEYCSIKYPTISYKVKSTESAFSIKLANKTHHFIDTSTNLKYKYYDLNMYSPYYSVNNINLLKLMVESNNLSIQPTIDTLKENIANPDYNVNIGEDITYSLYSPTDKKLTAVSNIDYETDLNESRRKIKLLYPEYLTSLEEEVTKLFNNDTENN